jgi:thiol-disulfide isomerase/thioredoxin
MVRALAAAFLSLLGAASIPGDVRAATAAAARPAPPFPSSRSRDWIGAPADWPSLRGKVVLLDVWTFECVNCVRTIPWIKEVRARFAPRGLEVIGIHTPEMESEHDRTAVAQHVRRYGLDFPQLLDNDYAYWRALENHYWPTLLLVDRCGRIRGQAVGEVHAGEPTGERMEAALVALLAEEPASCSASPLLP